ncbi:hypothetical protein ACOMHN_023193 [Nucella lapillus]
MSSRRGSLTDSLVSGLSSLAACKPPSTARRSPSGSLSLAPHSIRISTLKRHSLASVELAEWTARAANRRGSAFTLRFSSSSSSLSPVEAARSNESLEGGSDVIMHRHSEWLDWVSGKMDYQFMVPQHMPLPPQFMHMIDSWKHVQAAIIRLFQRKPLKEQEMSILQETVRTLSQAEAGSLIHEYYKEQLMKKGMVILREKIKNEQGDELLEMLGETWDYFFTEILPTLQALMYPLAEVIKDTDIRNTTLLEFRNIVVLKVGLKEAVECKRYQVPANVRQMMLVLQGLKDPTFLSKEQLDLEKMTACVIVPFLGTRGLYQGAPDPVTRANYRPPMPQVPQVSPTTPNITITVCEDSPSQTQHQHQHQHQQPPPSPLSSPATHRMEQKHPIASPSAMRKRLHPPPSPTSPSSPSSPSSLSTFFPSSPTLLGSSPSTMHAQRLKPVIEGVPCDLPALDRRHSIVGT